MSCDLVVIVVVVVALVSVNTIDYSLTMLLMMWR